MSLNDYLSRLIDSRLSPTPNINIYSNPVWSVTAPILPRNPACWANDFDISFLSPCNNSTAGTNGRDGRRRGGTLYTPRHICCADHASIQLHEQVWICDRNNVGEWYETINWAGGTDDIRILELDRPVANGINFVRSFPDNWHNYFSFDGSRFPLVALNIPRFVEDGDANCGLHESKQIGIQIDIFPRPMMSGFDYSASAVTNANRIAANIVTCAGDSGQPSVVFFSTDLAVVPFLHLKRATINGYLASLHGSGTVLTLTDIDLEAFAMAQTRSFVTSGKLTNQNLSSFVAFVTIAKPSTGRSVRKAVVRIAGANASAQLVFRTTYGVATPFEEPGGNRPEYTFFFEQSATPTTGGVDGVDVALAVKDASGQSTSGVTIEFSVSEEVTDFSQITPDITNTKNAVTTNLDAKVSDVGANVTASKDEIIESVESNSGGGSGNSGVGPIPLTIAVRTPDDDPIPSAAVSLTPGAGAPLVGLTGNNGNILFGADSIPYTLSISAPGWYFVPEGIAAQPDAITLTRQLTTSAPPALGQSVSFWPAIDGGGAPQAAVEFQIELTSAPTGVGGSFDAGPFFATSGGDGMVRFNGIRRAHYRTRRNPSGPWYGWIASNGPSTDVGAQAPMLGVP